MRPIPRRPGSRPRARTRRFRTSRFALLPFLNLQVLERKVSKRAQLLLQALDLTGELSHGGLSLEEIHEGQDERQEHPEREGREEDEGQRKVRVRGAGKADLGSAAVHV